MAGGKRLGRVWIRSNGASLETMPGATLLLGGVTRSPVIGSNAVLGYSEAMTPAEVECEVSVGAGISLKAMGELAGVLLTFECDTGQIYSIANASLQDPPKIGGQGTVALKFFGDPAEEMGV